MAQSEMMISTRVKTLNFPEIQLGILGDCLKVINKQIQINLKKMVLKESLQPLKKVSLGKLKLKLNMIMVLHSRYGSLFGKNSSAKIQRKLSRILYTLDIVVG